MPDILIRGMEMPGSCAACDFYNVISGRCTRTGTKINFSELTTRSVDCPISELPQHGELIETKDVLLALVEHGQRDKRFKLGDTIRYSPSEVKEIIDASVPVIVPAEREGEDAPD